MALSASSSSPVTTLPIRTRRHRASADFQASSRSTSRRSRARRRMGTPEGVDREGKGEGRRLRGRHEGRAKKGAERWTEHVEEKKERCRGIINEKEKSRWRPPFFSLIAMLVAKGKSLALTGSVWSETRRSRGCTESERECCVPSNKSERSFYGFPFKRSRKKKRTW